MVVMDSLILNYTRSDGDIAFPTFTNLSGVVDVSISESTAFSANSSLAAFSFHLFNLHLMQN